MNLFLDKEFYKPMEMNRTAYLPLRQFKKDEDVYKRQVHPSVVMCRGYYTRTVLAAFDWDGKNLKQHWVFDSNKPGLSLIHI